MNTYDSSMVQRFQNLLVHQETQLRATLDAVTHRESNGDHDVMVSSEHSADMARRIPNATLKIYPDSGHGGVFQHHEDFVPTVNEFLDA